MLARGSRLQRMRTRATAMGRLGAVFRSLRRTPRHNASQSRYGSRDFCAAAVLLGAVLSMVLVSAAAQADDTPARSKPAPPSAKIEHIPPAVTETVPVPPASSLPPPTNPPAAERPALSPPSTAGESPPPPVVAPPPVTGQPPAPPAEETPPPSPPPSAADESPPPAAAEPPVPPAATLPPPAPPPAGPKPSQYTLAPAEDAFLRLDNKTGQVSRCSKRPSGWTCELLPDDRAALEAEIARLQKQNAALKADLIRRGLPVPQQEAAVPPADQAAPDQSAPHQNAPDLDEQRPPETVPQQAVPPRGDSPPADRGPRPHAEGMPKLPDMAQMEAFAAKVWRQLLHAMQQLRHEAQKDGHHDGRDHGRTEGLGQ